MFDQSKYIDVLCSTISGQWNDNVGGVMQMVGTCTPVSGNDFCFF